jgi:hypothetical protein
MEQAEVAATLRWFVARSGVVHVVAQTAYGTFGCDGSGHVTVQHDEAQEPVAVTVDRAAVAPDVDVGPEAGAAVEDAARAALALSRALGAPPAVVAVWLAGEDDLEVAVTAQDGEDVVVMLGDEEIEMEAGWPPPR